MTQHITQGTDHLAVLKDRRIGIVLYTDGGARPSRGMAGVGIHGYCYDMDEVVDKPIKQTDVPTDVGYGTKVHGKVPEDICGDKQTHKKAKWVKPLLYVDYIRAFTQDPTTNNQAEIQAITDALTHLVGQAEKITLWSDSQTTVKGATQWYKNWQSNGWVSAQGKSVENQDHWKALLTVLDPLRDKVRLGHIPAHSGYIGNELADKLATRGIMATRNGLPREHIRWSPPASYWNKKAAPHRFLSNSKLYFATGTTYTNELDKTHQVYYLGNHGRDDVLCGKRASDHTFSVVALKQKDPVIDALISHHTALSPTGHVVVCWVDVGKALSKATYNELLELGVDYLSQHPHHVRLVDHTDTVLTDSAEPAMLAYRAIDTLNNLETFLLKTMMMHAKGITDDHGYRLTDVTDVFIEKNKLKKSINQQTKALNIKVHAGPIDPQEEKIRVTLGIDLPTRNTLNGISDRIERIYVLTISETEASFYYYFIIVTKDDEWGIWAAPHANMKLMS